MEMLHESACAMRCRSGISSECVLLQVLPSSVEVLN